jgi:beta-ribofuranosylaminobenzene 5'-phosphate synthase
VGCRYLKVNICTPSRLHFGLFDMRGDQGRLYGSAGVAIQRPRLTITAEEADETVITGKRSDRAQEIISQILEKNTIDAGVHLDIKEDIPEHQGFGSGTQFSIAIGTALNRIFDLGLTYEEIVLGLGRGKRSGIGTHSFQKGGFIVDGGHSIANPDKIPPLIHRSDVPDDWFFVVCIPEINTGISGTSETNAFKKLEPPPSSLIADVSRLVLMGMIPSIVEKDITTFGDTMTKLDTMFGEYWATMQGGVYSHPRIGECVNKLLSIGAYGAGQSSWGPTLYGLAEGETQAKNLTSEMGEFLNTGPNKGTVFVTRADNEGAKINQR